MMLSHAIRRQIIKARQRPDTVLLGRISPSLCTKLIAYHACHQDQNMLAEVIDNRLGRDLPMEGEAYLMDHYSQVRMDDRALLEALDFQLSPLRRVRISCLAPGATIPEHIDDPDQWRGIALLSGRQTFELRQGKKVKSLPMAPGEAWYVNTSWPHCITNPGKENRLALLFDLAEPEAGVLQKHFGKASP